MRESESQAVKDVHVACRLIGGRRDRLLRNRRALVLIGLALSIEFLLQLLLLFLQRYNSLFPRRSLQVPVLLDEDLVVLTLKRLRFRSRGLLCGGDVGSRQLLTVLGNGRLDSPRFAGLLTPLHHLLAHGFPHFLGLLGLVISQLLGR